MQTLAENSNYQTTGKKDWVSKSRIKVISVIDSRWNNGDNWSNKVKFSAFSNYEFALADRPWLKYDHYLTIQTWDQNFDPKDTNIEKIVMWIRILSWPIKLFDHKFLTFLGNRVGKTLKVNMTTLEQACGKYAHICVDMDPKKELLFEFTIHSKMFFTQYVSTMGFIGT